MNREGVLTLVVAVLCIAALGASAATLEDALSTDPDDVIDFRWESLPLGQEEAKELKEEMEATKRSGSGAKERRPKRQGGDDQGSSGGEGQTGGSAKDGGGQQGGQGGLGPSQVPIDRADLLDRLLALLRALLPFVLLGLGILSALGLLYRYRRTLWALVLLPFGLIAGILPRRSGARTTSASASLADLDPQNEVESAWFEMVKRANVESPRTKTPGECARVAREAGMDPAAVDTLTRAFEEIRYGGRPVTDDHRHWARRGRRELGLGEGS